MSVRRREWRTANGEARSTWIVTYSDQSGARRIATFKLRRDADAYEAEVKTAVRAGVHSAPSVSKTIAEAGRLWIATGEKNRLERSTLTMYRQQLSLHIAPYLGTVKLSQLSAPMVREFEDQLARDGRSAVMVRKVRVSLVVDFRRAGARQRRPQCGPRA
jgi:integrase